MSICVLRGDEVSERALGLRHGSDGDEGACRLTQVPRPHIPPRSFRVLPQGVDRLATVAPTAVRSSIDRSTVAEVR